MLYLLASAHHLYPHYRFLARKTNLSTVSGFKAALWQDTILPPVLKTRSEGELVAGIHRYRFARRLTLGYVVEWMFHHARGLVLLSA